MGEKQLKANSECDVSGAEQPSLLREIVGTARENTSPQESDHTVKKVKLRN